MADHDEALFQELANNYDAEERQADVPPREPEEHRPLEYAHTPSHAHVPPRERHAMEDIPARLYVHADARPPCRGRGRGGRRGQG